MLTYSITDSGTDEAPHYTATVLAEEANAYRPTDKSAEYDATFLAEYPVNSAAWQAPTMPAGINPPFLVLDGQAKTLTPRASWEQIDFLRKEVDTLFRAYYKSKFRLNAQHSRENSRILDSLVAADVFCNVGGIMDFILSRDERDAPYSWEDAKNLEVTTVNPDQCRYIIDGEEVRFCRIDEDGDDDEIFTALLSDIRAAQDLEADEEPDFEEAIKAHFTAQGEKAPHISTLLDEYDEPETTEERNDEIYEYWAIDGRLSNWLEDAGEVIFTGDGPAVWGRQTTGQAIASDGVIWRVAMEHGILYGLKNQW